MPIWPEIAVTATSRRVRWLLIFLAAVGVVRLVIVPWLNYQSDLIAELQTVSKRLDRSQKLLSAKEAISTHHQDAKSKLEALRRGFPSPESTGRFKVDIQQSILSTSTSSGVTLRSFDWVGEGDLPGSRLQFLVARMEIFGNLSSLGRSQSLIESNYRNLNIREARFVGEVPANARDNTAGLLIITAEFYFFAPEV
jgi:hypothetical protein